MKGRIDHLIVAGQRSGVREGDILSQAADVGFEDQDRLVGSARHLHQPSPVPDALQVDEDQAGAGVVDQIFQHVFGGDS